MKRVQNWRDYLEDSDGSWREKINRKRKPKNTEYDEDKPRDSKRRQKRK